MEYPEFEPMYLVMHTIAVSVTRPAAAYLKPRDSHKPAIASLTPVSPARIEPSVTPDGTKLGTVCADAGNPNGATKFPNTLSSNNVTHLDALTEAATQSKI